MLNEYVCRIYAQIFVIKTFSSLSYLNILHDNMPIQSIWKLLQQHGVNSEWVQSERVQSVGNVWYE